MTFSFKLREDFLGAYRSRKPPFGFQDAIGTSLGEITFLRTYSRVKEDGSKETWVDCCERVINGMYSIQKDWCKSNRLPWDNRKAHRSAEEAFDLLFDLKWSPPGRGLWGMGTPIVMEEKSSAPLLNCGFVSTSKISRDNPGAIFAWVMEASMLGIGVGFDVMGAEKRLRVAPSYLSEPKWTYVIPDTREGWAESVRHLINAYLAEGRTNLDFDYSQIRPKGEPIKRFGGTASGPEPLKQLHQSIRQVLEHTVYLGVREITDLMNLIGVCVVAGNVRRSAEIAIGPQSSEEFLELKDYSKNPERAAWGWMSNNTVIADVDDDLSHIVPGIHLNGEPGVLWLEQARSYGRMVDAPTRSDERIQGSNPCGEILLQSYEMCNISELYPSRSRDWNEFLRALKYAYLYSKTVTLLTTPWPETNAVMLRNRRIGVSMSGVVDFMEEHGVSELARTMDSGYRELQSYDRTYSEWLGVRESVRLTTNKPSGTVSLLAGVSPGIHWQPGSQHYYRLIRVAKDHELVRAAEAANYRVEPAESDPQGTAVIYFPMVRKTKRGEHDVSVIEKANLAMLAQKWWSDNSVSVTLSFRQDEEALVEPLLKLVAGNLKSVSFLPLGDASYAQMPYTQASDQEIQDSQWNSLPIDLAALYAGSREAEGERFCTTDKCELK